MCYPIIIKSVIFRFIFITDCVFLVGNLRHVDEFILKFSGENAAVVCTNDKKLKKRLKKEGIRVIQMRGKSRLEFL